MNTTSVLLLNKSTANFESLNCQQLQHVIVQVLEAEGLYTFAELLALDQVKSMEKENESSKKYFNLLQIFSHGTLKTYKKSTSGLPTLTVKMQKKLQLLSLMTLASNSKFLSYKKLSEELFISNQEQLEDIIITAIYQNVIEGRINQQSSGLEIHWCMGRDVTNSDMNYVLSSLQTWCSNCEKLMKNIETQIKTSHSKMKESSKQRAVLKAQIEENEKEFIDSSSLSMFSNSPDSHVMPKSGGYKSKKQKTSKVKKPFE